MENMPQTSDINFVNLADFIEDDIMELSKLFKSYILMIIMQNLFGMIRKSVKYNVFIKTVNQIKLDLLHSIYLIPC